VHSTKDLVDLADCVASLSCETVQAFTAPFAAPEHDVNRPHKAASLVAVNLRLLLENSFECDKAKRKADVTAFATIPQVQA
jgi:histidine ammonia-lyase